MSRNVYSVTKVNEFIKDMFAGEYFLSVIFVKGEVSNCKYHSSGHIYFTLKDKASQIACVMFAGQRGGLSFRMDNGQEVIVGGSISVYERDGKYQLYAKRIEAVGDGAYYEKFEQLKRKLYEKGMFDDTYKKPIPHLAQTIGIVTAETGAAIQDIINVSRKQNPYVQLILYPAKVQGDGAAETIVSGIRALDREGVDVIIVGRGGGSIEDLWAFNEEMVAQAIFDCQTPVISAVGHETDTTISDYVADMRAPTPSAAAARAAFSMDMFMAELYDKKDQLVMAFSREIDKKRIELERFRERLQYLSPENQMMQKRQYLLDTEDRLWIYMKAKLNQTQSDLTILTERLNGLSPLNKISSGFAYVKDHNGTMIDSIEKVHTGETICIAFSDGECTAKAESIERKDMVQWLKK